MHIAQSQAHSAKNTLNQDAFAQVQNLYRKRVLIWRKTPI